MLIKDYKLYQLVYLYGTTLLYSIFLLTLTGIVTFAPTHILTLQIFLKYYVCLFLIIQFNPFKKIKRISKKDIDFERKIAFSAGMFLLLTSALTQVIYNKMGHLYNII
jgi:hypothetical protein